MALAWADAEHSVEEEHADSLVPRRTCTLHGWGDPRGDRHSSVIWSVDPWTGEEPLARHSTTEDQWLRPSDLFAWIRSTTSDLQSSPLILGWVDNSGSRQFEELVRTARELLAGLEHGHDYESDGGHELIDWRLTNRAQWESGIRATVGEDGEPLNIFAGPITSRNIPEDSDEEFLYD